jgi:hypothetical protein
MNHFVFASPAVAALLSLSAVACSASTPTAARSPAVAFEAPAVAVNDGCALEGMPRVVATHVVPRGGVTAVAADGKLWLRFATTRDPRVSLALDPSTLDVVDGAEPPAQTAPTATRGPVQVELEDHRHLVAWTEGSFERGLSVKVATVSDDGIPGAPADLGYQGSAIGQPALAVASGGAGLVAFIESNDAGFQVVVTRATCAAR